VKRDAGVCIKSHDSTNTEHNALEAPWIHNYLYFAQENIFKIILVFSIDVLWEKNIAATRALIRNGAAE